MGSVDGKPASRVPSPCGTPKARPRGRGSFSAARGPVVALTWPSEHRTKKDPVRGQGLTGGAATACPLPSPAACPQQQRGSAWSSHSGSSSALGTQPGCPAPERQGLLEPGHTSTTCRVPSKPAPTFLQQEVLMDQPQGVLVHVHMDGQLLRVLLTGHRQPEGRLHQQGLQAMVCEPCTARPSPAHQAGWRAQGDW